jgi:hypothetical protein
MQVGGLTVFNRSSTRARPPHTHSRLFDAWFITGYQIKYRFNFVFCYIFADEN